MDRQGYYRTIGRGERAYRSFVPTPLQDIHLEMDEEMQKLLAQAHERLKNRNISDIDALQKEEVENSVNLVYGEKKPISTAIALNVFTLCRGNLYCTTFALVESIHVFREEADFLNQLHHACC